MTQTHVRLRHIVASVLALCTSACLAIAALPQQGWSRPGCDLATTARYPVAASPNAGSLGLLLGDTSLRDARVLTAPRCQGSCRWSDRGAPAEAMPR